MHNKLFTKPILMLLAGSLFLSGCAALAPAAPTTTPLDLVAIQTDSVATFIAGMTLNAPTLTPTPAATETPTITETPQPTATPSQTLTPTGTFSPYLLLKSSIANQYLPSYIPFYVIAPMSEDPCLFYLEPVLPVPYPPRTGKLVPDVTTALNNLFRVNNYYIEGLPNPLAPSGLSLTDIKVNAFRMDILISGDPARTENTCTNRMMRDQIFKTVHAISDPFGVTEVVIWLDRWTMLYDDYMIGN